MGTQESSPSDDKPAERGAHSGDPPRRKTPFPNSPPVGDTPFRTARSRSSGAERDRATDQSGQDPADKPSQHATDKSGQDPANKPSQHPSDQPGQDPTDESSHGEQRAEPQPAAPDDPPAARDLPQRSVEQGLSSVVPVDQLLTDQVAVEDPSGIVPYAHFDEDYKQKPQRYNLGRSKVQPTTPLDPIKPYMSRPPRRRKSDWPVLLLALVVATLVMTTCCLAGFALYRTYGLH